VPNKVFDQMPEMSDSGLRCLLALIHLSFRFDPAKGEWVHTEKWLTRSDVEEACGLSSQGTRNGITELKSIGWVSTDRSGRSHQFRLEIEVPARRFTYVPTALLGRASGIGSGTELRVALAVLRGTWGWTCKETGPESGELRVVHDRWARLSNRELAEATGRSETAVGEAAKALQGEWIERVRPSSGPYQYRFLPERVGDGSGAADSFYGGDANDLAPDRQKSGTPTYTKENSSKDKQEQPQEKERSGSGNSDSPKSDRAVPAENNPDGELSRHRQNPSDEQQEGATGPDFSDLPPEKQQLAEKLTNVGVWAGRIAEILTRFSCSRIRANFELYRERAAHQTIRRPGAWLYEAIMEGYTLPSAKSDVEENSLAKPSALDHKEVVSESKKDAYVAGGIDEERFHRCLSPGGASSGPQFMYFSPEEGEPEQRV
jgi:hypothetical protein